MEKTSNDREEKDCRNNFQEVKSLKQAKSFHNKKLFKKRVNKGITAHTERTDKTSHAFNKIIYFVRLTNLVGNSLCAQRVRER
jgi:hypothetical protein